ncbi:MAG: Ig-like domain-containing protein, partial [Nitrospirae bacterium]|nr:Ig-like domain-containing protein [Nitrospirota bacterium]
GVISFVVQSSTVSGTANVTAQSVQGTASGGTSIVFTAGPPAASTSSLAATSPVFSDGINTSTITATVRDANNNLVSGATVTLSSSRGGTDAITQPAGVTNVNGQIAGTAASTTPGDAVISALVNGTVNVTQTAAIYSYNTPTGSNVVVPPTSDTQVTFSTVTSIGITSSTPPVTTPSVPSGYASPVYYDISTTAGYTGSVTVCIVYNPAVYGAREGLVKLLHQEGSLVDKTTSVNTATDTVCGAVPYPSFSTFATATTIATNLQFATSPQTVTAGNVSGVVTVEARDNYGARDDGYAGTVNVTSNSATLLFDTGASFTNGASVIQVNVVNGVGSFYFRDVTQGTPKITVTDAAGSLTQTTQQETILPGVPVGTISLTPNPASIVANGVNTSTVTSGILRDLYGNQVSDGTLVTVATDRGTITMPDAGADAGIQVATSGGVISFVVRSGTVAGTANISAASVTGSASGSAQITFLPGLPAGTIALTPNPASIVADGISTSTVTSGAITDVYGNTVLDGTLVTVVTDRGTITTADVSGADAGIQVATTAGVIAFAVQAGTSSGLANVTAASVQGTAGGSAQITFTPGLPAGTIALTANPSSIVADGTSTSTVTSGVITDVNGNTVLDGTLITVATDRGTITTLDAGASNPGIQVTTVGGTITFVVRSSVVAGTANVTAASVEGSATGAVSIPFLPGVPYGTISLTPAPSVIPADGVSTSVVTSSTITDFYGNTVLDGTLVTVTTTLGTITTQDAGPSNSGLQVSTLAGVIVFTVQAGTTEGTASVTAASVQGSASGQAAIAFTNVAPVLSYSSEAGYFQWRAIHLRRADVIFRGSHLLFRDLGWKGRRGSADVRGLERTARQLYSRSDLFGGAWLRHGRRRSRYGESAHGLRLQGSLSGRG